LSNPVEPLPQDGTGLIRLDPWLEPYADRLRERYAHYQATKARLLEHHGSLRDFAGGTSISDSTGWRWTANPG
jgi:1,4-alpha-glucan branching enzyme